MASLAAEASEIAHPLMMVDATQVVGALQREMTLRTGAGTRVELSKSEISEFISGDAAGVAAAHGTDAGGSHSPLSSPGPRGEIAAAAASRVGGHAKQLSGDVLEWASGSSVEDRRRRRNRSRQQSSISNRALRRSSQPPEKLVSQPPRGSVLPRSPRRQAPRRRAGRSAVRGC